MHPRIELLLITIFYLVDWWERKKFSDSINSEIKYYYVF